MTDWNSIGDALKDDIRHFQQHSGYSHFKQGNIVKAISLKTLKTDYAELSGHHSSSVEIIAHFSEPNDSRIKKINSIIENTPGVDENAYMLLRKITQYQATEHDNVYYARIGVRHNNEKSIAARMIRSLAGEGLISAEEAEQAFKEMDLPVLTKTASTQSLSRL